METESCAQKALVYHMRGSVTAAKDATDSQRMWIAMTFESLREEIGQRRLVRMRSHSVDFVENQMEQRYWKEIGQEGLREGCQLVCQLRVSSPTRIWSALD